MPGAAVGVFFKGREHFAFHGVIDIENPTPVDAETLFQYGSTGKTYTATAIMCLVERGLVDLDEPVRTYIPELKLKDESAAESVKLLNLLNHTAGWQGDFFEDTGNADDALEKYVEKLADVEQEFPVGTSFSYNNAAVNLAGRVIEKVTGKTYEAAIKAILLDPIGLNETFLLSSEVNERKHVVGHTNPPGEPVKAVREAGESRSETPCGANCASTIADQIKWARFHLNGGVGVNSERVLSETLVGQMRQPTVETHGVMGDYVGISWMLEDVGGVRMVGHGGNTRGQQSAFEMVPERDFAVAVLSNADPNGYQTHQEMINWALSTFLGVERRDPVPVDLAEHELHPYVGTYETIAVALHVFVEEGGLRLKMQSKTPSDPDYPAFPLGVVPGSVPRVVVTEGVAKGLKGFFVQDDSGAVTGLHIGGRLASRV